MSSIDIYSILSSKSHNPHYLSKYFAFIQQCQTHNKLVESITYTEKHHICPSAKTMFPEYQDFTTHSWNLVHLTARQHFIAHWMLWKAYNNSSMAWAFAIFKTQPKQCTHRYTRFTSRIFERLRLSLAEECRKRFKNKPQTNEHIAKRVAKNTGKKRAEAAIEQTAQKNTGQKRSNDTKAKMSEKARARPKIVCEYCSITTDVANYHRWHGYNCKMRIK